MTTANTPSTKPTKQPAHGWLVLDKPGGITSMQAITAIKRTLPRQKIGHAGTLDPLATGILPIALGEATKTIAYIQHASKEYDFTMTWGEARDTDDAEGKCIATSPIRPSREAIAAILPQFRGAIWQTPPVYSAIKQNGKRAYALARKGTPPRLAPRQVTIHALTMTDHQADTTRFSATTGKGVYIRALVRDIAKACGGVGYISLLRRTRVGGFGLDQAVSLNAIARLNHTPGKKPLDKHASGMLLHPCLLPLESALVNLPAVTLAADEVQQLRYGQAISMDGKSQATPAGVHACIVGMYDGCAVALMRLCPNTHTAQPVRVFHAHATLPH